MEGLVKQREGSLFPAFRNSRSISLTEMPLLINVALYNTKASDSQEDAQILLEVAVDNQSYLQRWSG